MGNFLNITGKRFRRLVAIRQTGEKAANGAYLWLCQCDCGKTKIVSAGHFQSGYYKSCGCVGRTATGPNHKNYRHGYSRQPLYAVWENMIHRCSNANDKFYGGRGIKVCERWHDFVNFLADMGERPAPNLTIDRINNDGDYEPGNCRWTTRKTQSQNRRAGWWKNAKWNRKARQKRARGMKRNRKGQFI